MAEKLEIGQEAYIKVTVISIRGYEVGIELPDGTRYAVHIEWLIPIEKPTEKGQAQDS